MLKTVNYMENLIKIRCENNNSELFVKPGTSLLEVLDILNLQSETPFISAYVDNKSKDLNYVIYEPRSIKYITQSHFEGARVYQRTLFFVLYKAVADLFPKGILKIKHSIGTGHYFVIENITKEIDTHTKIKERMDKIIAADITILRHRYYREEAREIYTKSGLNDKISIIDTQKCLYLTINQLADRYGYFYGTLAPSTSHVKLFDIKSSYAGFYLCLPQRNNPLKVEEIKKQDKLFEVFHLHKKWNDIIDVSTLGALNGRILNGEASELIKIGEALSENQYSTVAQMISDKHASGLKLVLIAGPSSSGKTTSSLRLNIQLRVRGMRPTVIAMDDYFLNREFSPVDVNGKKDFESIKSVDVALFNDHLNRLFAGETVEMPKYNFIRGERYYDGATLTLNENSVLIVEGIHALNPELTASIPLNKKFKLYVSALTSISMDYTSRVSTTDNRLLRRIVRDNSHRGHTALDTLRRWGSVRRGEEQNIFPYQEEADYMINSALFYELCVLKQYAEPLLMRVPNTEEEYSEAQRLLKLLDHFVPMDDKEIPPTSVLREFIGGSSFKL